MESTVNGPGRRAVVWAQGCQKMSCESVCWNKDSHDRDGGRFMSELDIMAWIDSLGPIEGITLSGGEPIQQIKEVAALINGVRLVFPELSVGMFSGYSEQELKAGKYDAVPHMPNDYRKGYWLYLRSVLDFAVLGRYNPQLACKEPLRTSRNQELKLYSGRYTEKDFEPQAVQVSIGKTGLTQITGFPTKGLRDL